MVELAELAQAGIPWSVELGFVLLQMRGGVGSVAMPWRADLAASKDDRSIATGAIAALVDQCGGMAVLSALDRPAGIATLNLKIDHFRPSDAGQQITAEARCYHRTAMLAFVRIDVWDREPGQPIAAAQAVFVLNRPATTGVHHG